MNPEQFRIFYNQTIQPELVRLDRKRRRLLRLSFFSLVLMTGAVALIYSLGVLVLALLAAIPFAIHLSILWKQLRKFKQTFKPQVVKLVLDFIDDNPLYGDLAYRQNDKVALQKFMASAIFGVQPNYYQGEDFIEGRIGDVEFELSELDVKRVSRIRPGFEDVFRGIFLRAKFYHAPKGILLAVPRATLPDLSSGVKAFIGKGNLVMDGFVQHRGFREKFAVYGSRDTKVAELLPKELMDYLLRHLHNYGNIYLSVFNQNCYVAISNKKDILEPKIFQSNVSFELVREFYDDINVALYVAQALDEAH